MRSTRAIVAGALALAAVVGATTISLAGGSPGGGTDGVAVPGDSGGTGSGLTAEPICAEDEPVTSTGPDTSVSSGCLDTPVGDAPAPQPQVVVPTPGMADVYARPFDAATIGDDDVTLTIDFVSGIEPCYVLDRVDVRSDADAVTVTLFEGHDPSAGDVACIEIGVFKRVVITLDEPLAGRAIVDGAA